MKKIFVFCLSFVTTYSLLKYVFKINEETQNNDDFNNMFNEFDHKHLNDIVKFE